MEIDRKEIDRETIREVPYAVEIDERPDFDKYSSHHDVVLELHAQDRDKATTGWAAIARDVHDARLRMKVLDPVKPDDLWGKDTIRANIVIVSRLTSEGFTPSEIHLTQLLD